jgi:hypothetical protein
MQQAGRQAGRQWPRSAAVAWGYKSTGAWWGIPKHLAASWVDCDRVVAKEGRGAGFRVLPARHSRRRFPPLTTGPFMGPRGLPLPYSFLPVVL